MTDARVIKATFAEWKMIKTRKVLQLVLEIPLEQQGEVLTRLGPPMPDQEKWVAVALLDGLVASESERPQDSERCDCGATLIFDDENGIAHCPSCKSHESYIPPPKPNNVRSLNAKRAYADKDESHRAISRAGILARDPKFWGWVNRGGRIVRNELDAAVYIRGWCEVESRKEFAIKPGAYSKYLQLETEYRMGTGQMAENRG